MKSKVISSGKAVLVGSFISKGISIFSSIILARLLFEKDYGAMVLSAIFAGLITQIGGMGYELYYLQFKGPEEERHKILQQVYNLRLVTNIVMFLVQALIGLFLFLLTDNKMSGGILMLMSVSLLLEGFNAPQETILKDQLEFRKITIGNIFKELFSTIGKVSAALLGLGGYAFGVGPILGSFTRLIYLRRVQPYSHEYFSWDKPKINEIFKFGKHVLFGSAAMYLVQQIDRIFLTLFFSQNIVGRYGFAWGNAAMPFNYLVMPQHQLIMTYITRFKVGQKELFDKLNTIKLIISLVLMPILILALLFTNQIVILLFTDRWIESVILIKIILCYYAIISIFFPYTSLLTGLGRPDLVSKITLLKGFFLIIGLYLVGLFNKGDIVYYLVVYSIISICWDAIKVFIGIKMLDVSLKQMYIAFKFDLINIVLIISVLFLSKFPSAIYVKGIVFASFMVFYLIIYFIIEKSKTFEAINIYKFKILK